MQRLTMKITEKAFLPSTEREKSHGCGNADVYTNIPGHRFMPEFSGCPTATRKNTGRIAVSAIVNQ